MRGTAKRLGLAMLGTAAFAAGSTAIPAGPTIAAYKKLSLAELMDLEVTSVSRRPETLLGAASAVQVITNEDIRRAGATRLPVALRQVANLHVAQIDSRQWAITTRGFNNTTTNKLLVQLDGRTLYTPLFAGVFWDAQDTLMHDIDRIEVISGPGATQWGSYAVNGVINIMTKSARDTQGGLLIGGGGNEPRAFGAARYGGTLAPGLYYRIYGQRFERQSSATPTGQDAGDAWHNTQGGFRVDWERNASDHLTLQGDLYQGRIGQLTNSDIVAEGANLLGRWTRTFGPKSELRIQSYYDYTHRRIPGSITEYLDLYDLDVQHRFPVAARHEIVWGGGYRLMDDEIKNPATLAFLPPNVRREWFNGFVQGELKLLNERLNLTGGVKVERNPYTGSEVQPSIRAAWRWRERRLIWGAISRAVRSPSRIDRELFAPATPPFVLAGGPSFKSETLLAYELGFRAELQPKLSASLATFYHDYDDLRSLEPAATPGGPLTIANGLEGESYGAELTLDYRPTDRWRLKLGYTEQRVHNRTKPGGLDRAAAGSQSLDPDRLVILTSQIDLTARTTFDFSLRYIGEIEEQNVPDYVGLAARLSWQPVESLELAIAGRNLLDRMHPEFGPPATRREIERSVNASFTWRF